MGGSRGGPFAHRGPKKLADLVRQAEDKTADAAFETVVANSLASLLSNYNDRDDRIVRERLDEVKAALEDSIEGTVDQLFGGSVAKHTYVDGLSDIDSLVIINDTTLEDASPQQALARISEILRVRVGESATISAGRMAVTVEYADGMKVQLLPALRAKGGRLRVPSSRHRGWSGIDPSGFREALTRRNQECGGKLIPTIKLAKAINGTLPESRRLSGYHLESLAIAAFRNYSGLKTTRAMLPALFEKAQALVLSPIRDSSGQSVHVDEYLGSANSEHRRVVSHILGRVAKRMRNATVAGSIEQWQALFGLEE